jgi:hypothetical protein
MPTHATAPFWLLADTENLTILYSSHGNYSGKDLWLGSIFDFSSLDVASVASHRIRPVIGR